MTDGQIPDDKQLIPEQVGQNPGGLPQEDDHEPREPIGSHWKPPSDGLIGWSIVVGTGVGILALIAAVVLVLLALNH